MWRFGATAGLLTLLLWCSFCGAQNVDLMFVVDSTASITPTDFATYRAAFAGLADQLPISSSFQVGVLQYGNQNVSVIDYRTNSFYQYPTTLGACANATCFRNAITSNMPQQSGANTFTATAVERAILIDFNQSANAADSKKYMVISTDGAATDGFRITPQIVSLINSNNVVVYAIGVTSAVVTSELTELTGNSARVRTIATFAEFATALNQTVADIVAVAITTTTMTTTTTTTTSTTTTTTTTTSTPTTSTPTTSTPTTSTTPTTTTNPTTTTTMATIICSTVSPTTSTTTGPTMSTSTQSSGIDVVVLVDSSTSALDAYFAAVKTVARSITSRLPFGSNFRIAVLQYAGQSTPNPNHSDASHYRYLATLGECSDAACLDAKITSATKLTTEGTFTATAVKRAVLVDFGQSTAPVKILVIIAANPATDACLMAESANLANSSSVVVYAVGWRPGANRTELEFIATANRTRMASNEAQLQAIANEFLPGGFDPVKGPNWILLLLSFAAFYSQL